MDTRITINQAWANFKAFRFANKPAGDDPEAVYKYIAATRVASDTQIMKVSRDATFNNNIRKIRTSFLENGVEDEEGLDKVIGGLTDAREHYMEKRHAALYASLRVEFFIKYLSIKHGREHFPRMIQKEDLLDSSAESHKSYSATITSLSAFMQRLGKHSLSRESPTQTEARAKKDYSEWRRLVKSMHKARKDAFDTIGKPVKSPHVDNSSTHYPRGKSATPKWVPTPEAQDVEVLKSMTQLTRPELGARIHKLFDDADYPTISKASKYYASNAVVESFLTGRKSRSPHRRAIGGLREALPEEKREEFDKLCTAYSEVCKLER